MISTRLLVGGSGSSFVPPVVAIPDQGQGLPGTFTKYGTGPVIARGASGTWDDNEIDGECVFYDARLGKFVMAYSANDGTLVSGSEYFKIGFAYSDDLYTWTKEATNPVFSPGYGVIAPTIVQKADLTYVMYYQSWPGSSVIYCATSSDLLTWTVQNGGSAVLPVRAGQWDETVTFDPNARLMDDGTTIQLFYSGQDHFGSRAIGYAYTTDNVTMTSRTFLAYWDSGTEVAANWGASAVVASSDTHYGFFCDASAVDGFRWIDRLWTTNNGAGSSPGGGTTMTRESQVLTHSGGGWDSGQVFDSAAIWWEGVLYLLHCGSTVTGGGAGLASDIGIATMPWPS